MKRTVTFLLALAIVFMAGCKDDNDSPAEFSVTFKTEGAGGKLTATADGKSIESGAKVVAGTKVAFTATPDEGNMLKEWKVNGTPASETGTTYTHTVDANTNVSVSFIPKPVEEFAITFGVEGTGGKLTAMAEGAEITSGAKVKKGAKVAFTAAPDADYSLKEWTVNGKAIETTELVYTHTMEGETDIKVSFMAEEYVVTFGVEGNVGGKLLAIVDGKEITSGNKVIKGAEVLFTAAADADYKFEKWTVNGKAIEETDVSYTHIVEALTDVKALFVEKGEPHITFVCDFETSTTIYLKLDAAEKDKPNVWIDLNGNGKKDSGEGIVSNGWWDPNSTTIAEYELKDGNKTVTVHGNITKIDCTENRISKLDVSNAPNIEFVNCLHNQLKEKAMQDFLKGLPNRKNKEEIGKVLIMIEFPSGFPVADGNEIPSNNDIIEVSTGLKLV